MRDIMKIWIQLYLYSFWLVNYIYIMKVNLDMATLGYSLAENCMHILSHPDDKASTLDKSCMLERHASLQMGLEDP